MKLSKPRNATITTENMRICLNHTKFTKTKLNSGAIKYWTKWRKQKPILNDQTNSTHNTTLSVEIATYNCIQMSPKEIASKLSKLLNTEIVSRR